MKPVNNEMESLSTFHSVHIREAVIMIGCAIVIGNIVGILAAVLNSGVHFTQGVILGVDLGWFNILIPAIGAGTAVFLLRNIMVDKAGHGVSEMIKSVSLGDGKVPSRMAISRLLTSWMTVGSGGSAGLEGPIVCVGGAVGSWYSKLFGKDFKFEERHRKLLVGYGVAAAISGIFNAPITGIIFALEIILGEWTYLTILPTIAAAISGTEMARFIMGNKIVFYQNVPDFTPASMMACVALGVLTGVLSVVFTRTLSFSEDSFKKIKVAPWVRATIGGFFVGVLGFFMPEVLAEGYLTTQDFVLNTLSPTFEFVLAFIALKALACWLTLGSGGIGGVFAPSLVLGSGIGLAYGMVLEKFSPFQFAGPEAFSLVGMAGMVAGVMHSPLTGVFLVMEASRGYSLILPLMLTAICAMVTSYALGVGSVYTRSLAASGDLVRKGSDAYLLHYINLREILDKDFITIEENLNLEQFIEIFKVSRRNLFPILKDGDCVGIVFLDDVRPYLFDPGIYSMNITSLMKEVPIIDPDDPVGDSLKKFRESKLWSLPVVSQGKYLGMLSKSTLFDHYRSELLTHTRDL